MLAVAGRLALERGHVVMPEQPAGICRSAAPLAAEQSIHRLALRLPTQVPERDVDAADRRDGRALATVPAGEAVHLLPEGLGLQRILADKMRPQIAFDDDANQVGVAIGSAEANQPRVGPDADQGGDAAGDHAPGVSKALTARVIEPQRDNLDVLDSHDSSFPSI